MQDGLHHYGWLMQLYDLATKFATEEGKDHREVFQLLCSYLDVDYMLKEKKHELQVLNKKIGELKVQNIILTSIKEGKIGKG